MNPYASYLGNAEPLPVLEATAERLRILLERLGPEGAERAPAPGKWPAKAILSHLADTEIVDAFRLRQALAEPHHVIQPYDQDRWAAVYALFDARAALELFTAVRNWNLSVLRALPPEAWAKPVTHPERGELTIRVLIETAAGHDLNHLVQLESLAAASSAPSNR